MIKPLKGTGYSFFALRGESSFHYFLEGKSFSLNEKDNPGKTYLFIDDIVYEPIVIERADFAAYVSGSTDSDVLREQAKHEQDYFKKTDPAMVVKDYGLSIRKNSDGSDGRVFYLWRKESPPGKQSATQYLLSTMVRDGVVVLSLMITNPSVSERDVFRQIEKYTSTFDSTSSDVCAKVLSAPTAP